MAPPPLFSQTNRFKVIIDSIEVADFTRVEGLSITRTVTEVREGGENTHTHKRMGPAKYSTILLHQGSTSSASLFKWINRAMLGEVERKNGSIVALGPSGSVVMSWDLRAAWPCRYEGPDPSRAHSQVAIEVLELAHRGIELRLHESPAQKPSAGSAPV